MTADNSPSRSLVVADASALPVRVEPEIESAAEYARAEKAAATRRAYRSDFALFRSWCEAKGLPALPAAPAAVAAFLAAEASRGAKVATIGRRLAAIRYAHKLAGHELPTNSEAVKATLRGIRRTAGSAPARKAPATADKVLAMVAEAETDLKGIRDRAILLLGFAGAFRRAELVALNIEDLHFCDGGLRVLIRRSKTDQEGLGATIAVVQGSIACRIVLGVHEHADPPHPLALLSTRSKRPCRRAADKTDELASPHGPPGTQLVQGLKPSILRRGGAREMSALGH
jgi:site-specific recombinase XerC